MRRLRLMAEVGVLLGWFALGSASGGIARFFVSGLIVRTFGATFPLSGSSDSALASQWMVDRSMPAIAPTYSARGWFDQGAME